MLQCAPAIQVDDLPDRFPGTFAASDAATPLDVLRFVMEAGQRGQHVALVTITGLTGSSSRSLGTLMGVAENGRFSGSFSGGCIEAAVVAEAQEAIRDGRPRQVRYGAGSPYIDIRLPCGGGVDLLFQPSPDPDVIRQAVTCLAGRQPLTLAQSPSGGLHILSGSTRHQPGWRGETFISWYAPPLGLVVVGHGAESLAMLRLGLTLGTEMRLFSPDERVVTLAKTLAKTLGVHAKTLTIPGPVPDLVADPWGAIVFLFHDHAWEPLLLEQALTQPWFFIGAMGSRRTHAKRLATLRERGLPEEALTRIIAPLGLIPSARDPATLALSALAQVVDGYRKVTAMT
ncbi:XdhC family protein [Microvirga sp. KLBC 81]|uniref:XdhC family protein n=1 Tax=Microvirga sp. KLBC 81 TaxID=1862707 RepID=UPI001402363A|nr:XdhC family protein [Microvirga sp. KLBC 81]